MNYGTTEKSEQQFSIIRVQFNPGLLFPDVPSFGQIKDELWQQLRSEVNYCFALFPAKTLSYLSKKKVKISEAEVKLS